MDYKISSAIKRERKRSHKLLIFFLFVVFLIFPLEGSVTLDSQLVETKTL